MDDIVREFVVEGRASLERMANEVVALESMPYDEGRVASAFRAVHNVKATAGFLGFTALESVTHIGEDLLNRIRTNHEVIPKDIVDALLAIADASEEIFLSIDETGTEGTPPNEVDALPQKETPTEPAAPATVRVSVRVLDELMDVATELMLLRNDVRRYSRRSGPLRATATRIDQLTTQLRDAVLRTRMQRIEDLWAPVPRIVRGLADDCGKQVRFEVSGQETELDKTVLEAIREPVMHLIRNAIDHGIETPEEREKSGKPPEGTLACRTHHDGAKVNIEISDDGRGIDYEGVRLTAIARGHVSAKAAATMTRQELLDLIFVPGLTTKNRVTKISGRGVGMDAVRDNIERVGGTIEVRSQCGLGSTIRIKIPLTLALVPASIITCRKHSFAVPQVTMMELIELDAFPSDPHQRPAACTLRDSLLPLVFLDRVLGHPLPETDPHVRDVVVMLADGRRFGLVVDGVIGTEEIVVKPFSESIANETFLTGSTILEDGNAALILDSLQIARHAGIGRKRKKLHHAVNAL